VTGDTVVLAFGRTAAGAGVSAFIDIAVMIIGTDRRSVGRDTVTSPATLSWTPRADHHLNAGPGKVSAGSPGGTGNRGRMAMEL
jgi:hypothetical protein